MHKFPINERLVRGLGVEEKKEFITAFKSASWMLSRIRSVLEADIDRLIKESESDKILNSLNYSELQRLNIAERRALRQLVKLLPKIDLPSEDNEDGKEISINIGNINGSLS